MKHTIFILFSFALFIISSTVSAEKVSPEKVEGATTVDAVQAKALFDKGVIFIDVRKDKDWAAGRIPDAIQLELKKVLSEETLSKEVKKDQPMVIYCNGTSCMRSSKASAKAVGWGFKEVYYFRLGIPAWKAAGYPTE